MALKQSGLLGTQKLHEATSEGLLTCDLCGQSADSEVAECVLLDCSARDCPAESACYHQACLEAHLKKMKCERNRKLGFPCPRGHGKGTKFPDNCRGKILKSHPLSIRSEANKKRRQAELDQLQVLQERERRGDPADKKKRKEEEAAKAAAAAQKAKKGGKAAAASAKQPTIKAVNVASTSLTKAAPLKTKEQLQKEQLAATAQRLKSQILGGREAPGTAAAGAPAASSSSKPPVAPASSTKKAVKTLDEYLADRSAASSALERASSASSSQAAAPASAWAKARSGASSQAGSAAPLGDGFGPPLGAAPPAAASAPGPAPTPADSGMLQQGAWGHKASPSVLAAPVTPAGSAPIPGMAVSEQDGLSKTQRKNLKRAEKKAAVAARVHEDALTDAGSVADTLPESELSAADHHPDLGAGAMEGGGLQCGPDFERCVALLVQHKLQRQVEQLVQLGFGASAALAAVQAHGGNLEAAVAQLLGDHAGGLGGGGPASPSAATEVDLSEELQQMQALQLHYGVPIDAVEAAVVRANGDLEAAAMLLAKQAAGPAPSTSSVAVEPPSLFGNLLPTVAEHAAGVDDGWGGYSQLQATTSQILGGGGLGAGSPDQEASHTSSSAFSAFGFAGFGEAAINAVGSTGPSAAHTAPQSLFSSMDSLGTPSLQDAPGSLVSSLWSDAGASPHGGLGLPPAPGGAGDTGLLAMLGVGHQQQQQQQHQSLHGGLGLFSHQPLGGALQPSDSLSPYDLSHSAALSLPAFSGGLGGLGGQEYGVGLSPAPAMQQQQPEQLGGGSLWGSSGLGSGSGWGLPPPPQQQQQPAGGAQHGVSLEEKELNELMATLLCR